MSKISKVKRCYHCGAILQDKDPNEPGYISGEIIDKYPDGLLVCNECYKSEKQSNDTDAIVSNDYYKVLEQIKNKKALIVYVLDLFSFEGSFIDKVTEILNNCDVLAVGNKRDLLPDTVSDEELLKYMKNRLKIANLNVSDAIITSTISDYNIDKLIEKIHLLGRNKDVYFLGSATSGKTALIELILKKYENKTSEYIVTFTYPGTSIRGFKIPLGNKHYIFEMPGLPNENSIVSKVGPTIARKIIPNKTIVPKRIRLNKKTSLILGGLAFVQLIDGNSTTISVYCSKGIDLKTTIFGIDKFNNVLVKQNLKPCCDKFRSIADFDIYDLKITEDGEMDIGISGLGWFTFVSNNQTFRVFVPKGVYVYTTRSKIK